MILRDRLTGRIVKNQYDSREVRRGIEKRKRERIKWLIENKLIDPNDPAIQKMIRKTIRPSYQSRKAVEIMETRG